MSKATAQTILSNVSYLAYGPRSGATLGNGLVLSRTYNANFFLDNIDVRPSGGSRIMSRAHAFADNLNLTALNDNAIAPAESQAFDYDFAQRLKTAVGATARAPKRRPRAASSSVFSDRS